MGVGASRSQCGQGFAASRSITVLRGVDHDTKMGRMGRFKPRGAAVFILLLQLCFWVSVRGVTDSSDGILSLFFFFLPCPLVTRVNESKDC